MLLETFYGSDLRRVLDEARRVLGDDALIVRSRVERRGTRTLVEVVAGQAAGLARLHQRLTPPPAALPRDVGGRGRSGPHVVALVGPTGSGKTSTLLKLALHPRVFVGARVGLLTLDTWRVAALEQLRQYAEIGNLPLEAVYQEREVDAALARLDTCDVVLVDTPGRSPRDAEANHHWHGILRRVAPDETHLVLPAATRADAIPSLVDRHAPCAPTHLLVTKTDELWADDVLGDVVLRLDLPMRWTTNGNAIPDDVRPARATVLSALGMAPARTVTTAAA